MINFCEKRPSFETWRGGFSLRFRNWKNRWTSLLLLAVALLFLASCYTVPETGRSTFSIVNASDMQRLGVREFEEIKSKEKRATNPKQVEMVKRVGSRVAKVVSPDLPEARWEFVLFENPEPNAFALPGGKVGVNTGILSITQNEAGLAAVIGHEVAHLVARHPDERMSRQLALEGISTGLALGLGGRDSRVRQAAGIAFGVGVPLAVVLPHSRLQESEADRIGMIYMARADYPPDEAIAFWQRFREYNRRRGEARPPSFLSTHPADEQRIEDLRRWLPEARSYYRPGRKK